MRDLIEKCQDKVPDYSFRGVSETGELSVDLFIDRSASDSNTVTVRQIRPVDLDELKAEQVLLEKIGHADIRSLVLDAGWLGSIGEFGEMTRNKGLADKLGYRWEASKAEDEETEHAWLSLTYPTVDFANSVLDDISPGEGVRLESYPSGKYSAVEGIDAFLRDRILVAEDDIYQIHDHSARHVLGYIGLFGAHLENIKSFGAAYMDRFNAELRLPDVPDPLGDERIQMFLRPSHQVLKALMASLDEASTRIGQEIFKPQDDKLTPEIRLTRIIQSIYMLNSTGNISGVPNWIFRDPEVDVVENYARNMRSRYQRMSTLDN